MGMGKMSTPPLAKVLQNFHGNPPAPPSAVREAGLGEVALPSDYLDFLTSVADGGAGIVGESYLILWRLSELAQFNSEYEVERDAPGLFLFGSNGGGEAIAFDMRSQERAVVQVPFVGMELELVQRLAGGPAEFLRAFAKSSLVVVAEESPLTTGEPASRESREGKEIFEIQPVILGGSLTDPANKTVLTRRQHIEAVRYWNAIIRDLRKQRNPERNPNR